MSSDEQGLDGNDYRFYSFYSSISHWSGGSWSVFRLAVCIKIARKAQLKKRAPSRLHSLWLPSQGTRHGGSRYKGCTGVICVQSMLLWSETVHVRAYCILHRNLPEKWSTMSSNCGLAAHCVATGSPCSSFSQDTQKIIDKIQNGEDIHIGRMVKTWPLSSWPGRVFLDNTTSQKWCGLVMLAASSYISLSFRPSTNMMWNIGKQFLYIHSRLQFFLVAELLRCLVLIARTSKRTNGGASTPQTLSPGMIWHVMWLWCGWCDDFPKVPAPRSTVCVEYLNRCKTSIFYIVQ